MRPPAGIPDLHVCDWLCKPAMPNNRAVIALPSLEFSITTLSLNAAGGFDEILLEVERPESHQPARAFGAPH